jgi:hypothetical protein
VNPGGSWRLPFDEDFTKLAVVSDPRDGEYYRSAGYVAADAGYTEEISSRSSFEGESGFYAATFHDGQLRVMNRDYEWIDPASGDVKATSPKIGDTGQVPDLYIDGSENLEDYGFGDCWDFGELPSRVTSKCYESAYGGDIEFYSNKTMAVDGSYETIDVANGAYDSLLALDSKDNFYCVEELDSGQQRLVRVDNGTGEAREITPETDQEILQAIVSSNDEQVLFTARRDDDPLTAYAVPAAGGTGPRELPALAGYLSNENQKLYSWTAG